MSVHLSVCLWVCVCVSVCVHVCVCAHACAEGEHITGHVMQGLRKEDALGS